MTNGLVESFIFLHEFYLMLLEFFFLEVFVEVISPFVVKFSGILIVSSTIEGSCLGGNPVMNYSQVCLLLHL